MTWFRSFLLILLILVLATGVLAKDTLIVLNKEAASAWLIDPASGEARAKLKVGEGPHEGAVSPDGRTAVVCNYGGGGADGKTLTVIDVAAGKVVETIDLSPYRRPHGIAFFPGGQHVLVTSESSRAMLKVDVTSGEVVATFDTGGSTHMCAVAGDGKLVFGTAFDGFLSIVDLKDDAKTVNVETGSGTEALALRPNSEEVWVGNNNSHEVLVVNTASKKVMAKIECGLQPIRLAFTLDGRFALASCILSGDLAVIDADQRSIVRRVALSEYVLKRSDWEGKEEAEVRPLVQEVINKGARPIGVLPGPDGRFVYVAARGLDYIAVIDLETWELVQRLPTGKGPDGMAFSRIVGD